jgi:cytoskeletal protein CcmA (bactofilin family)
MMPPHKTAAGWVFETFNYKEIAKSGQQIILVRCAIISAIRTDVLCGLEEILMGFGVRLTSGLIACLFFLGSVSTVVLAESSHDRTQFGHDISVGPNEETGEVTCFGCSVRVRGHINGDVTVFAGSVTVEDRGEIGGDTTIFAGNLRLDKEVKIRGDVTVFGGRIHREPESMVGGDVTNFGSPLWIVLIFGLPLAIFGAFIALVVWLIRRLTRPSVPATA